MYYWLYFTFLTTRNFNYCHTIKYNFIMRNISAGNYHISVVAHFSCFFFLQLTRIFEVSIMFKIMVYFCVSCLKLWCTSAPSFPVYHRKWFSTHSTTTISVCLSVSHSSSIYDKKLMPPPTFLHTLLSIASLKQSPWKLIHFFPSNTGHPIYCYLLYISVAPTPLPPPPLAQTISVLSNHLSQ